jgi:hypothetical protein
MSVKDLRDDTKELIMKNHLLRNSFFIISLLCSINLQAQEGANWVVFDSDYPKDFIDSNSITLPEKGIVRFWERAGNRIEIDKNGKVIYAQYTLREINCALKQERGIKWDCALEDQNTTEGLKARADHMKVVLEVEQKLQLKYPTEWQNIEPNKHSYARYNFVCKCSKKIKE